MDLHESTQYKNLSTAALPFGHSSSEYQVMVPSLVIQELLCCALLTALFYLTSQYLSQHMAYQDTIVKPYAVFLGSYLIIKTLVNLVYILHYQGTLQQGSNMVSSIIFVNEIAVVILNIGTSLNLFKWLVILNRVYLHSGNRSKTIFQRIESIHLNGYVFFVTIGSLI